MLCIPQGREQPINAGRVEACAVGRMVVPESSTSAIASALRGLLDDGQARVVARAFADVTLGLGGGALATDQVVRLWRHAQVTLPVS
jgi:UDP:flavonoid glycosyltransferase YjiC (YdhE family)